MSNDTMSALPPAFIATEAIRYNGDNKPDTTLVTFFRRILEHSELIDQKIAARAEDKKASDTE